MAESRELNLTKCPLIRPFVMLDRNSQSFLLGICRPKIYGKFIILFQVFWFDYWHKKNLTIFIQEILQQSNYFSYKWGISPIWIHSTIFSKCHWMGSSHTPISDFRPLGSTARIWIFIPTQANDTGSTGSEWQPSAIDMLKNARFFCVKSIHLHGQIERNVLTRDRPASVVTEMNISCVRAVA